MRTPFMGEMVGGVLESSALGRHLIRAPRPLVALKNLEMSPEYLPRLEVFIAEATAALAAAPADGAEEDQPSAHVGCMGAFSSSSRN